MSGPSDSPGEILLPLQRSPIHQNPSKLLGPSFLDLFYSLLLNSAGAATSYLLLVAFIQAAVHDWKPCLMLRDLERDALEEAPHLVGFLHK